MMRIRIRGSPGIKAEGRCGRDLKWELDRDSGTLTISGNGDMADGNEEDSVWGGYPLRRVVISNGVTSIGSYAFARCASLESMEIPDSVISIGKCAFYGCASLLSVNIPHSVRTIRGYAFFGCTHLAHLYISGSVRSIGEYAFFGCRSLISVKIPDSVESVGERAFGQCLSLSSVTVPDRMSYREFRRIQDFDIAGYREGDWPGGRK